MNILDAVQARGVVLKKVAPARGGEWAGPCLVCKDGQDRFRCWPNADQTKQVFFCRHCKPRGGDLIEFFRWADGMGYREACQAAGCEARQYHYPKPNLPPQDRKASFRPTSHEAPGEIWNKKAGAFVDLAHERLMSDAEALAWLQEKRGISAEGAQRFKLGLNSDEKYFRPRESWGLPTIKKKNGKPKKLWLPRGLVIPYRVDGRVQRIRIRRPKSDLRGPADPPYYFVPGSSPAIMLIGKKMKAYMVVESELDGILIAQDAGDLVGVVAMGTATSKPDKRCADHLSNAQDILVSLDSDTAGNNGSDWWLDTYRQAVRWRLPCGKDPGEMFKTVDVRRWVLAGLPPAYHCRNGPSALHRVREQGAAALGDGSGNDQAAAQDEPDLPASVERLGALLKQYPVWIINTVKRTAVDQAKGFHNESVLAELSSLVFFDPDCGDHIANHPAEKIDRSNFLLPDQRI